MKKYFNDKVVIITGSSMGIGKTTALELCKLGAKVIINGRNPEKLKNAKNELNAQGYNVTAFAADITDFTQCTELVKTTINTFGKLDILITNAGISMRSGFEKMQPDVFKKVTDSNIYGTVFPIKAALPYIIETKGHIVLISSLAGLFGLPAASAYSMGKMALTALWQSMQIELSESGIHTGIVYVGFTRNEDTKRVIDANGNSVPVAHRPAWLQQSRQQVANSIIRLIYRRKSKVTLSVIGKLNAFFVKFFPRLVSFAFKASKSKLKSMLE